MKITTLLVLCLGLGSLATRAAADDRYLLNQADRLEAISYDIARELRHTGGYGGLRDDAERLAREARHFRDSLERRSDRHYVQARYDDMLQHYNRFERNYRRTAFPRQHRHVEGTYLSITAIFHNISGGYLSYSSGWGGSTWADNSWGMRYYEPPRVIYYQAPPVRRVMPPAHGVRNDWGVGRRDRDERHERDRHDSNRRDRNNRDHDVGRQDRGRPDR